MAPVNNNQKQPGVPGAGEKKYGSGITITGNTGINRRNYIAYLRRHTMTISTNEFHISKTVRDLCEFEDRIYASTGNAIFQDLMALHKFQTKLNQLFESRGQNDRKISAANLNAMGLIDEIFHYVCMLFRKDRAPNSFKNLLADLDSSFTKEKVDELLMDFMEEFPPVAVYKNEMTKEEYLSKTCWDEGTKTERTNREQTLEELILLHLANENPAFHPFAVLFDDEKLKTNPVYTKSWIQIKAFFETQPVFGPKNNTLINMLKEPVIASPTSLKGQLDYIRTYWATLLGEWIRRLLEGIDSISEEEKAAWHPTNGGEVSMDAYNFDDNELMREYERFSPDREWMPKVILMAKTVLVWLYQLSKKYNREITRLDQIPDEELDALKDAGFTGLWLIGLWERSYASKRIKQINGNPEAASSAYSLLNYEIAGNLGGWSALENLRWRCWQRGIRLASDMVPNHTGMDGNWVTEHPDYFITTKECPSPSYTFNGENLSHDGRVSIFLEDHYYSKNDCAVCFKRVDNQTGDVTYIYHGNDGTGMPWNDTAQIDYLNPVAREAVMQQILKVARNFPIIRFDAAMVLAKKHIRRLWYPQPGHGGDIYSRSRYALTTDEFEARIPNEFWREVVDRCAQEIPDTLLLAEAFWMMEGYFTRTLGMHRVYNSAFMNMLKKEENQKYRDTVKNTIKFDPQILKRYVNFMNNPDEETAVAQFGKGDKYFGVCTLMVTMPGLPMFGHGQLEGFEEKYGMEYTRAYKDEQVDEGLMNGHRHLIFPLMHKRYLFAQVENFLFYDVWNNGSVNENIFAYSNLVGDEGTVVFYNNKYEQAQGWIKQSCEYAVKTGSGEDDKIMMTRSLGEGLNLSYGFNHYVVLREHKSGLWYLRKSDELLNNGMFVMLNGFESQVYTDVRQVEDTAEGKYAKLYELLKGKGCEDLEIAWQEYHYKELYAALSKFISPEFTEGIHELFAEKENEFAKTEKKLTAKALLKSISKHAMEYYKVEDEFLAAEEKLESDTKKKKTKPVTAKKRFDDFSKKVEYLADLFASELKSKKKTVSAEKKIFEFLKENELSAEMLICSASITHKFAMKWGLNRKFTEIIRSNAYSSSAKISVWEMRETLAKILVLKELEKLSLTKPKDDALEITSLLVDSKAQGLLSGANEFDGIKWFNKEKIEKSLELTLAILSMSNQNAKDIQKVISIVVDSIASSDYKCEKLLESLKPKTAKKAAKKTSAKATATKAKAEPKKASATKATATKSKAETKKASVTKASATKTKAEPKKASATKATATKTKAETKKTSAKATATKIKAEPKKASAKATATKTKAEPKKASATKATATKGKTKK